MTDPGRSGWVSSMPAPARTLSGRPTQLTVGLIRTQAGALVFAAQIGEDGEIVILPPQSAFQLIAYSRMTMENKQAIEARNEKT